MISLHSGMKSNLLAWFASSQVLGKKVLLLSDPGTYLAKPQHRQQITYKMALANCLQMDRNVQTCTWQSGRFFCPQQIWDLLHIILMAIDRKPFLAQIRSLGPFWNC